MIKLIILRKNLNIMGLKYKNIIFYHIIYLYDFILIFL